MIPPPRKIPQRLHQRPHAPRRKVSQNRSAFAEPVDFALGEEGEGESAEGVEDRDEEEEEVSCWREMGAEVRKSGDEESGEEEGRPCAEEEGVEHSSFWFWLGVGGLEEEEGRRQGKREEIEGVLRQSMSRYLLHYVLRQLVKLAQLCSCRGCVDLLVMQARIP